MRRSSAAGRGCKGRIRPEVPQNHRSAACAARFRSVRRLSVNHGAHLARGLPSVTGNLHTIYIVRKYFTQ